MKLVLFGDSLFGQAGKHRLEMLEAALGGRYDVYNCAAGGWDSNDCVKKAPYISKLEPELVVISLGTNDAAPWKQVSIETFTTNIPKIIDTFPSSKFVYFLPPPVNESSMSDSKKTLNNQIMQRYHEEAKTICDESGIAYINSWEIFKPMLDAGDDYHIEDGVHLNDRAYQIIWNELSKVLS